MDQYEPAFRSGTTTTTTTTSTGTREGQNNEPLVRTREAKTLLVRHLPAELNRSDKQELLKYFGAVSVRHLSHKGPLKHAAFATFSSEKSAGKALGRLHQLEILNHVLVVEFAKGQDHVVALKDPPVSDSANSAKDKQRKQEQKQPDVPVIETGIAPNLGLKFQTNPSYKYLYPPPSNGILTNISHAIVSVPKFYVQVLHLMNRMNLPCPFGPLTVRPPMFEALPPAPPIPMPPPMPPHYPPLPQEEEEEEGEEMDLSSGEGSEYESGEDEDKERIARLMGLVNRTCKRPLRTKVASRRKKPKIKDLLYAPRPSDSHSAPGPTLQPSDIFEQPQATATKRIEFHISVPDVAAILGGGGGGGGGGRNQQADADESEEDERGGGPAAGPEAEEGEEGEGFGKMYPSSARPSQDQDGDSEDSDGLPTDVISRKELDKGRLSRDEIKRMSVFKKYEPGEPTCRLYVKNIAKQVEEKDLKYIYGRYIDPSSEAERNMFDIVLMKEGRMKGQAFVGLPSERSAQKALRDTNGYVLHDRPLVVQFARSARPKADAGDAKKGARRR